MNPDESRKEVFHFIVYATSVCVLYRPDKLVWFASSGDYDFLCKKFVSIFVLLFSEWNKLA